MMIERGPSRPSAPFEYATWDPETIATYLYSQAETIHDDLLGDGYRVPLGAESQLDLNIYPAANTVRITSWGCSIELQ